jgi:hypothetical protein
MQEEAIMRWVGVACVAVAVTLGSPAAGAATKSMQQAKAATSATADIRARRIFRDHPAYVRSYSPAYFARPYYYAPYPYGVPVPFFLGFGYLPYY